MEPIFLFLLAPGHLHPLLENEGAATRKLCCTSVPFIFLDSNPCDNIILARFKIIIKTSLATQGGSSHIFFSPDSKIGFQYMDFDTSAPG